MHGDDGKNLGALRPIRLHTKRSIRENRAVGKQPTQYSVRNEQSTAVASLTDNPAEEPVFRVSGQRQVVKAPVMQALIHLQQVLGQRRHCGASLPVNAFVQGQFSHARGQRDAGWGPAGLNNRVRQRLSDKISMCKHSLTVLSIIFEGFSHFLVSFRPSGPVTLQSS